MTDEFQLIEIIRNVLKSPSNRVRVGLGDDAAVLKRPDAHLILCSDCMVEGVHFTLDTICAEDLGAKAVAACLSDLAAMNAKPLAIVVSLALPKRPTLDLEKFVRGFYDGIQRLRQDLDPLVFDVVGGDLSSSPSSLFIDVAASGTSSHPILRSGAKPGDSLAVSGPLGTSAAGFYAQSGPLVHAHTNPRPRFDALAHLDPETCHALIDVSDGLASEANHLANASGVSIEITETLIPYDERAVEYANRTRQSMLNWALYGGEDYELLASFKGAPPAGFTVIGRVLARGPEDPAVTLVKTSGERETLRSRGFNHFA